MESDRNSRARDRLRNLGNRSRIPEGHKGDIDRYEQAGKIGRFIIRRREPEIFQRYQQELRRRDYLHAQQSIEDARRFPDPDPSEVIIF